MRAAVLRSLFVIGVGALVLAGVLYVASTVDARPPQALSISVTQPVGGDSQVALITTSIEVAFSEPVMADAADAVVIEPAVAGAPSWSGSTLTITPDEPLDLESEYIVSLRAGIRDAAGNEMTDLPSPFTFRTAGRPSVLETVPADGATEVATDAPLEIRFSTLMDTASVEAGLSLDPGFAHEVRWSEDLLEIVPTAPLSADREYEVTIAAAAADVAGVELGEAVTIRFRTVSPGLAIQALVPADDVDGIALATPIAMIFDRPIDPATVDDESLTITPEVAGNLEVVAVPGDPASDDGSGRVLRFTPSGPLPPTTTFQVDLGPGVTSTEGGGLAGPTSWTFTTGAPPGTVSNQITFLTERSGVANVWAMNADGTGQRQVTVELTPVLDYAVAPDGSSVVVGDGRRLVFIRTDGSERRVLTADEHWEVDPTYAPGGQRVAFARFDAEEGRGLGLWEWTVGSGEAGAIDIPRDPTESPDPTPSDVAADLALRAPRYAPDGQTLAFVDASGTVGILDLPDQRLTRVDYAASAAPVWLPDGSAVLLTGWTSGTSTPPTVDAPVPPLEPGDEDAIHRLARLGTRVTETAFGPGWRVLAVAADGTIAYATDRGWLGLTASEDELGDPASVDGGRVVAGAFAPGESAMVIAVEDETDAVGLELVDLDTDRRTLLAPDGASPRWLP
jgi:hypothetical protein